MAQLGDVLDGVDDIGERRLIGEAELIDAGQAETEKDGVVIALQALQIDVAAERHAVLHRNAADREDEGGLSLGEIARRLVGGDAVFVEPGRLFPRFENRHVMAALGQRMGAGEPGGPGPDDRDALSGRRGAPVGIFARRHHCVGGVALQKADLHRLAFRRLAHASFLAQRFGRADARAHSAHDVGVENGLGGPERIIRGDLANEQGNVDSGRAGLLTRRVIAEIAAIGLDMGLVRAQGRVEIGEVGGEDVRRQQSGRDARAGDFVLSGHEHPLTAAQRLPARRS